MDNTTALINEFRDKNDKTAYKRLKDLMSASEQGNSVYQYFDIFAELLRLSCAMWGCYGFKQFCLSCMAA